jgi:hypothetical protein
MGSGEWGMGSGDEKDEEEWKESNIFFTPHTPYSLLHTPYSLLPTPYSPLPTPYSLLLFSLLLLG